MSKANGTANGAAIPQGTTLRTQADEQLDTADALQHFHELAQSEWPNDAGYDGLREEREPIEIRVVGDIPAWAAGNLYRTGPGKCKIEDTPKGTHHLSHWFDGIAQTHRFEIVPPEKEGDRVRVFYSSRHQSDELVKMIRDKGPDDSFTFAQRRDPCIGFLGKFMSTFKGAVLPKGPRDRQHENVNVVLFADLPGIRSVEYDQQGRPHQLPLPPKTNTKSAGHRTNLPDSVWVTSDFNLMRQMDPATLAPIGHATQESLHPDLKGELAASHALRDPVTGDFYNFNLEFGRVPTYRVFRARMDTAQADILATIPCSPHVRPAYIHSIFLSPRFVILCIPSAWIVHNGLKILWDHNVIESLAPFAPSMKTRWLVVDRRPGHSGVVAEFESDAGYFFHSVNAFEETAADGRTSIVCDVIDYPSTDFIFSLYYDILANRNGAAAAFYNDPAKAQNSVARLSRYRLALPADLQPTADVLPAEKIQAIPGPHSGELPTIHPGYFTKRSRYVYSLSSCGRSFFADAIAKADIDTRESLIWAGPSGHVPGEPVFLPRPNGTSEDDGILLAVVLDQPAVKSYLLCLDAQTMKELGRAEVGFAVGIGFHGIHKSHW